MSSEALDDPRLTVAGLLAETWAGFAGRITAQLAAHGLDAAEFEVLMRLARTPGGLLRMSGLAAQTSLTSSGITRLVDRLVAAGSVQRQACATDRRTTYAVITDKGRARLEAALPGHLELIERWLVGPIPSGELAAFVTTLRTLRDGVRPCAEAGAKPLVVPGAQASADVSGPDVGETDASGPDVSGPSGPDVSRPTVASAGPHAS